MSGKKILVADDSLTIQKVIRLALSNEGYEIQAVSDGNDAIQQIALFRPDIVLIDVSLPGKTAFEVKREINQHEDLEEIRFVLMSSAFEKVDEPQSDEVQFHGRLTKPFDPAHLRQVLTDVLAQVTAKRMEKTSILTHFEPHSLSSAPPQKPEDALIFSPFAESSPPPPPSDVVSMENYSEWETTKPDEPPPLTQPEIEPIQELWDADQELELSAPLPEPPRIASPPPLAPPPAMTETDIKELTESTINNVGLDDFQWSVKEPLIKPFSNMLDSGGTTFKLDSAVEMEEPEQLPTFNPDELEPFESSPGTPSMTDMIDTSEVFQTYSPAPPKAQSTQTKPSAPLNPTFVQAENPAQQLDLDPAASSDMIEALVARQVEAVLEKLARKLLPEVAERVIKAEIHRMLSE